MKSKALLAFAGILGGLVWIIGSSCGGPNEGDFEETFTYILREDGRHVSSDSFNTVDLTFDWEEQTLTIPVYIDGQRNNRIHVVIELFTKTLGKIPVNGTTNTGDARVLFLRDGTFETAIEFQQGFVMLTDIGLEDHPNETIEGYYDVSRLDDSTTFTMTGKFSRINLEK
jgi:hypothetical protein